MIEFWHSIQSEWMKTKRSAAFWLSVFGGSFVPLIYMIVYFVKGVNIKTLPGNPWEALMTQAYENIAFFLLPMGVILATSLITQLEYKNNAWKQVHASPQNFITIYLSKFTIIVAILILFFVFFTIAILLAGVLPCWFQDGKLPDVSFPVWFILKTNVQFFIVCLPIVGIQYLISLRFKNFLLPVGIGFLGCIGSLIGNSWEYIYLIPYSFPSMQVIPLPRTINIYWASTTYFILLMIIGYIIYKMKKEKG